MKTKPTFSANKPLAKPAKGYPDWAIKLADIQEPPPPKAITARQYAELTGRSTSPANEELLRRVRAGELQRRRVKKTWYYWPA